MVNLLFDDHPADIANMIVVDMIATSNNIAKDIFDIDLATGKITHIEVYAANPMVGLNKKIILLDVLNFFHSFVSSFIASLKGCVIP